jgi:hypothetical protein
VSHSNFLNFQTDTERWNYVGALLSNDLELVRKIMSKVRYTKGKGNYRTGTRTLDKRSCINPALSNS